jgi:hypothetical protein
MHHREPLVEDLGWRLSADAWGRLVYTDPFGVVSTGVEPVRAFPLGEADRWIALVDSEGHELALIENPATLPDGIRSLIQRELDGREFVPRITRIDEISGDAGLREWRVETDRGNSDFRIESDDQIRRLGRNRLLITDMQGLRYLIPDIARLDSNSRSLLDRYV